MKLSDDAPPVTSRDMAEAAIAQIAGLTILLDQAVSFQNTQLVLARAKDKDIKSLRERIQKHHERLEAWANVDRAQWGEEKSLTMRQGTIGFKWTNRSIRFLTGWTEAKVLQKLRSMGEPFLAYIRKKEELNKVLLLDHSRPEVVESLAWVSDQRLTPAVLKKIGITVEREERFFSEPRFDVVSQ
jgi:hypothetical protein